MIRTKTMALHLLPIQWKVRVSRSIALAIYRPNSTTVSKVTHTHTMKRRHRIERPTNSSNVDSSSFIHIRCALLFVILFCCCFSCSFFYCSSTGFSLSMLPIFFSLLLLLLLWLLSSSTIVHSWSE